MLKNALGNRAADRTDGETGDEEVHGGNEEELLSQNSDSIMECGPKKPRPGTHQRGPESVSMVMFQVVPGVNGSFLLYKEQK